MKADVARKVMEALEDALPYLARPGELREIVEELTRRADTAGKLAELLEKMAGEVKDQQMATDLRIVVDKIYDIV